MISRRELLVTAAAAAILSAAGASFAEPAPENEPVDRLLTLLVSDNFTTQEWIYEGQNWTEKRNQLVLFEDEIIELTVRNDSPNMRMLTLGPGLSGVPIMPARSRVLRFRVELDGHYTIGLQPGNTYPEFKAVELTSVVRPSYGKHPPVAL